MSLRTLFVIGVAVALASLAGCASDQTASNPPSQRALHSATAGAGDALGSSLFARQATDRATGVASTDDSEK